MENEAILKLYDVFMDKIYTMTPKNYRISTEISELEEELNKTLSEQQLELLEKIQNKESERTEEVYKTVFVYAYKLATKLLVEGLSDDKKED